MADGWNKNGKSVYLHAATAQQNILRLCNTTTFWNQLNFLTSNCLPKAKTDGSDNFGLHIPLLGTVQIYVYFLCQHISSFYISSVPYANTPQCLLVLLPQPSVGIFVSPSFLPVFPLGSAKKEGKLVSQRTLLHSALNQEGVYTVNCVKSVADVNIAVSHVNKGRRLIQSFSFLWHVMGGAKFQQCFFVYPLWTVMTLSCDHWLIS